MFISLHCVFRNAAAIVLVLSVVSATSVKNTHAQPAWKAQWEETLRAAEKEGGVVVYGDNTVEPLLLEVFQKKYPRIKVTMVTSRGNEGAERLLSERRAGKYIADLYIPGGSTQPVLMLYPAKAFDPLSPLLVQPEVLDQSRWWQGKHHYLDPEGQYIFLAGAGANSGSFYNTQMVDPNQIKSYWDLLGPKWKGKTVATDPTRGGNSQAAVFFYHSPDLGPEFVKSLFRDASITVVRSDEQLIDWVATGKFALGLFPRASDLARAEKAGLPVREFAAHHFREGAFSSGLTVSIMNRAPHPNAAKVLINWFLSREGQTSWLEYIAKMESNQDSVREDVPRAKTLRGQREPGAKFFLTQTYELVSNRRPINELIRKSLEESKKQ
jgi:iron(III) transport system substrate-binding protein